MGTQGIPKIIHQSWKSKTDLGPFKQEWVDSWLEQNPGWERRFWDDDDIYEFVKEEYPDFLDVFEEYDQPIKRPDSWRYLCLKRIGGVYADMDFACLKPLDSLVKDIGDRYLIARENDPGSPETYGNSFMACKPESKFLTGIEKAFRSKRHLPVLESSACKFITKWIAAGRQELIFEPEPETIFPAWWNDSNKNEYLSMNLEQLRKRFPNSYTWSAWTHTWKDQ